MWRICYGYTIAEVKNMVNNICALGTNLLTYLFTYLMELLSELYCRILVYNSKYVIVNVLS